MVNDSHAADLPNLFRGRAFALSERGDEVAEAVALHGDMAAQARPSGLGIASKDRRDDLLMFLERHLHAVAHTKLQAPVRPEPPV